MNDVNKLAERNRQQAEVDRNYDAFWRRISTYLTDHRDEFALMRDGQVVGFYKSLREAGEAGHLEFSDGIYSIQEATDEPIDLGVFSHA